MTDEEERRIFRMVRDAAYAKDDGGPAFPALMLGDCNGMTLRDWFAGQALAGICATLDNDAISPGVVTTCAKEAYAMADAMLTARTAQ